jgi:putative DNA methylase
MTVEWDVAEAPTEAQLGFDPAGFSRRGATSCMLCGAAVDVAYVKTEGKAGRLGSDLVGVGLVSAGRRGKSYVGSTEGRELLPQPESVNQILSDLAANGFSPPDEPVPARLSGGTCFGYGLEKFGQLFAPRQLVLLLTLSRLTRKAYDQMREDGVADDRAKAISTYLGLLTDRMADFNSTLCTWNNVMEATTHTFSRQSLPMTWDFSEANPFAGASGSISAHLEAMAKVVEHSASAGSPVRTIRASATNLPFDDEEFDAVLTDPPYYDNVSYADLSDFFYVWLQRSLGSLYPEHFASSTTPKRLEAIAARYRHDGSEQLARSNYESLMSQAFREMRRVLRPDGVLVCVYAHQTTAGWATLIEAVRKAKFEVVEAWPLDTEMAARTVAQQTASLASSIFLVARPRRDDSTGDWSKDVRPQLESIVRERLESLSNRGVTSSDLVIAAVGAGMRAYTRYGRVEKPNGDELAPDEYLEEVQREVAEAVLERIFGTDRTGLGRVDQGTQFYVMGRFEFGDAEVPWDELNSLARGTGVELSEQTNGASALVRKTQGKAQLRDFSERGAAIEFGRSTIDHLHRLLWLAENEPTSVKEYLEAAHPDADRLRLVARALSRPGLDSAGSRGAEAEACERLLGVWKRMVEDNLFTQAGA